MSRSERTFQHLMADIKTALEKIENYSTELTFDEFNKNPMISDAVIRNFEIIGEAASKIPAEIRNKYPDIPWREMITFRNLLIHNYFHVNAEVLWDTIFNNLNSVRESIVKIKL